VTLYSNKFQSLFTSIKLAVASSIFLLLPSYLNAISVQFETSVYDLSYLATVELMGFALASILCYFLVRLRSVRINETFAIIVLAATHLASAYCDDINIFLALRAISGVAAGVILVLSYESLSQESNPDLAFGKAIALQMLYSGLLFLGLPYVIQAFGVDSFFFLLASFSILLLALPKFEIIEPSEQFSVGTADLNTKILALAAVFMILLTHSGCWSMLSVVGDKLLIQPKEQGRILAMGTMFSLVGAILASLVSLSRYKKMLTISALFAQAGVMILLFTTESQLLYFVAVSLFMMFWNFLLPLFMGTISETDEQGDIIRLSVAAQTTGAALGPYILLRGWVLSELVVFLAITLMCILPLLSKRKAFTEKG
jgi:predicted MFS family arabinose efflux permease